MKKRRKGLWKKEFNSVIKDAYLYNVVTDNDGNYVAAGIIPSENPENPDGLIAKFDSNLNVLATKTYGGDGLTFLHDIIIILFMI